MCSVNVYKLHVYGSCVYKYITNTLRPYVNSADIPDAWQDQFFHRPCWTTDTAAPPSAPPPHQCVQTCPHTHICFAILDGSDSINILGAET